MVPGLRVSEKKGGHLGHGGRWSMAPHSREESVLLDYFSTTPTKEKKKEPKFACPVTPIQCLTSRNTRSPHF